ncbi:multidrug efflux SMR transporter [Mucilaginibacter defluvii]|uniref:SMR family transporter n=1 Tax=Mucilaginibacter defluvii TaxID=1196019 RepID=A0ABP9FNT0_9SPHI
MKYLFLGLAIVFEVIGSSLLQASHQFTRLLPGIMAVVCYLCCLYFFSSSLKSIPLGVAYAIWGGLGIVLTALVSVFVFRQSLDIPAIIGITMIVGGVIVMNVFSKSVSI